MPILRGFGLTSAVSILWIIMAMLRLSSGLIFARNRTSRHLGGWRHHHCTTSGVAPLLTGKPAPFGQYRKTSAFFRMISIPVCQQRMRLFSSASDSISHDEKKRTEALHKELSDLNIDATALRDANLQAFENPFKGYDGRYGRSAIRAYRSFINPKSADSSANVSVLAARCARQIDFLIKRHKSHEAEWVRHTDTINKERQTFPLIILLDNVRSAFNVGSLFRTADAAGCSEVITTGITPHPGGSGADKLSKSALGADRMVPSRHFDTTLQAIAALREELPDYELIGVETTELSVVYSDYDYAKEGDVLVLGNEVTGVDTEIIPLLDAVVEIPMFGAKNSLNIASCAPIVLYEVLRQWKVVGKGYQ